MAIVDSVRLAKTGLPPISDETAEVIENLADTVEWQLMLEEDLELAARNVDLLCAVLRLRIGRLRLAYRAERLNGAAR